jgi:metallophosphoesterase superfamily enzyme
LCRSARIVSFHGHRLPWQSGGKPVGHRHPDAASRSRPFSPQRRFAMAHGSIRPDTDCRLDRFRGGE